MPHGVAVTPTPEVTENLGEENKSPLFTPRPDNEQPPPVRRNPFALQTPARFEQSPGYFVASSTHGNVHPGPKFEPSDEQSGIVVYNGRSVAAQVAGPSNMSVDHPYQQLSLATVPPRGYTMNTGFANGTQPQATEYRAAPSVYHQHQHQPQAPALGGLHSHFNAAPASDTMFQRLGYLDQQGAFGGPPSGHVGIPHGHWHGTGSSVGTDSLRAVPIAPVSLENSNAGYDNGAHSQVARFHPAVQQGGVFATGPSIYEEQQRHAFATAHFRRAYAEFERLHSRTAAILSGQAAPSSASSHIAAPNTTDTHAQAPGESSDMSMSMSPPCRSSQCSTGNQ